MRSITYEETIRWKGSPVRVDAVRADNKVFVISGRLIKTAALKEEWQLDLDEPDRVIRDIKASSAKVDLLRFWQRIPESEPKYPYYHEMRNVAAIPITDYQSWFTKQISPKARNKVRKTQKFGVIIQ